MWIFFGFTLGVMLTMYRRPFFSDLTGRQPQPETEKMTWNRVQIQRTMRLAAMQENGHTSDGDMRHNHRKNKDLPSRSTGKTVGQEIDNCINKCTQNDMYSVVNVCFLAYITKKRGRN